MKKESKEMLKTIISNQELIIKALKITVAEKKAEPKKTPANAPAKRVSKLPVKKTLKKTAKK